MIRYAVTDPAYVSVSHFDKALQRIEGRADMVLYRDVTNQTYAEDAEAFVSAARRYRFKRIVLHADIDLACRLGVAIHLRSTQIASISRSKQKGLFTIVSTHSVEEVLRSQALGADMVTLSPIFDTPQKGKAIGVEALVDAVCKANIGVLALGGIVDGSHVKAVEQAGAAGFAAIRYFFRPTSR